MGAPSRPCASSQSTRWELPVKPVGAPSQVGGCSQSASKYLPDHSVRAPSRLIGDTSQSTLGAPSQLSGSFHSSSWEPQVHSEGVSIRPCGSCQPTRWVLPVGLGDPIRENLPFCHYGSSQSALWELLPEGTSQWTQWELPADLLRPPSIKREAPSRGGGTHPQSALWVLPVDPVADPVGAPSREHPVNSQ